MGAKLGVRHCWFGEYDRVTLELIHSAHDMVRTDPLLAECRTDNFLLLLYLLAWDRPSMLSYCVEHRSFSADDRRTREHPFKSLEAFEKWENGKLHRSAARFFLWLNRDVRNCAVSAINALFAGNESTASMVGGASSPSATPLSISLTVNVKSGTLAIDGNLFEIETHEAEVMHALLEAFESRAGWVRNGREITSAFSFRSN